MESKQDSEKGYIVVSTKVSPEAYEKLTRLARRKGLSLYELNQMVLDTLIRYMDDRHNLSAEMEQAMSIFEHMNGWKDALNHADPTVVKEVGEATYYLQAEGKKGTRAIHVDKPWMGIWTQTANIQQILERTICLLMPERYRRLRQLAVEMDCQSILQLIDVMIDAHTLDCLNAEFRQPFEDANRSDYGKKPHEGAPFRRKHHKGIKEEQPLIHFDDNDRAQADEEAGADDIEDSMGFRPIGGEW